MLVMRFICNFISGGHFTLSIDSYSVLFWYLDHLLVNCPIAYVENVETIYGRSQIMTFHYLYLCFHHFSLHRLWWESCLQCTSRDFYLSLVQILFLILWIYCIRLEMLLFVSVWSFIFEFLFNFHSTYFYLHLTVRKVIA